MLGVSACTGVGDGDRVADFVGIGDGDLAGELDCDGNGEGEKCGSGLGFVTTSVKSFDLLINT